MKKNISNKMIEFTVNGNNFSNLLNIINFHGIHIEDCKIVKDNQLKFTILKINESKIFDLLKNSCYTFSARERHNLTYYVMAITSDIGLIFALGVLGIFAYFYSYFVWDVKIYCDNPSLSLNIQGYLKQENIHLGSKKSSINKNRLEYSLLQNSPQLSQVDISFEGATLIVNVKEKLVDTMRRDFAPLISEYDGKIIHLELFSGTSLVNNGDHIKKGDIIVQPYMVDELGNKRLCKPQANIEIEAYFESSVFYDEKGIGLSRTSKKTIVNELKFFNMDVGYIDISSPYKYYEIEEKEILLSNILPIKILCKTYYELEYFKNSSKIDEIINQLILKCESELNFVDKSNSERIESITKINESCYNVGVIYKQLIHLVK